MSFEQLKEAILAEAQAKVQEIEQRYGAQRRSEESRIAGEARKAEEDIIAAAGVRGDREAARAQQERQLAAKSAVLAAKQAELETAQKLAADKLLSQDEDSASRMLKSLLSHLPEEEGQIIPGEVYREELGAMLPANLKLAEESIPGDGGFIYRSKQTEINLSLRHLMAQVFERHKAQLAKTLFS